METLELKYSYDPHWPEAQSRSFQNMNRHAGELLMQKLQPHKAYYVTVEYHELPAHDEYDRYIRAFDSRIDCILTITYETAPPKMPVIVLNVEAMATRMFLKSTFKEIWRRIKLFWAVRVRRTYKPARSNIYGKIEK